MPRVSAKRRVEDDISEYLVEMADMIEMDDAPDDEILDAIDAFFGDLSYLEESQSKRRYVSFGASGAILVFPQTSSHLSNDGHFSNCLSRRVLPTRVVPFPAWFQSPRVSL
jgi:hypothetical protein